MRNLWLLLGLFGLSLTNAQPYLAIEEITMNSVPAYHSGVYAHYDEYWILLAGRTNGLHDFRPPLAFPAASANTDVWVIDPNNDKSWSLPIDSLVDSLRDPLASSNLQWEQQDSMLYMVGGYGWDSRFDSFVTYPTLMAVSMPALIREVKSGGSLKGLFQQIRDDRMAICGAHMRRLGDRFYLVFGHDFNGRYHRNESAGFFKQEYSNEVRSFEIDHSNGLSIVNYKAQRDTAQFHRRDYNLVAQYFNGVYGYTAFSGVFQYDVDLPFYNCVDVFADSVAVGKTFKQELSHYHSAVMPVWNGAEGKMHTYFFGGMAEYVPIANNNQLKRDTMIPFVATISSVTRDSNGVLTEGLMDFEMPNLLGTNAHFFPSDSATLLDNGIVDYTAVKGKTLVGYIYGGIESELDNVNRIDVSMSWASDRAFAVYLSDQVITQTPRPTKRGLTVYPNPVEDVLNIRIEDSWQPSNLVITDVMGRVVLRKTLTSADFQKTALQVSIQGMENGHYFLRLVDATGGIRSAQFTVQ